ncbi:hypothetical protein DFP91_1823 [Pseudorhodoplanes sinuspersici]|nr:hypothetical protein DFP91_1823 [Pseudorhodoplanes sinuspersici]
MRAAYSGGIAVRQGNLGLSGGVEPFPGWLRPMQVMGFAAGVPSPPPALSSTTASSG